MKTYILINSKDGNVIANFTDKELAYKMSRVYEINGYDVYIQEKEITTKLPKWAEKILMNDK